GPADHFCAVGDVDRNPAVYGRAGRVESDKLGGVAMSGSRRLLIIGGIALAIWGMSYGLWYAVFAEHQALDNIGASLAGGFGAAAERNPIAMESSLERYREGK